MTENVDIEQINRLALKAGKAVMEVYDDPREPEFKSDGSPLTVADKLSHDIIAKGLKSLYPDIPLISEEGEQVTYDTRKEWQYFWLVDPLDGTKEFLKRNGEFTVNIAFIESRKAVAGAIYVPASDVLYYANQDGAFKKKGSGAPERIQVDSARKSDLTAARSRSHTSEEENRFLSQFPIARTISAGSSLKFCLIAEGKAHIYYRHGPTMEWDTAAGQAIVEMAGGTVQCQGTSLTYDKESLRNGSFVATVSSALESKFVRESDLQ